jgi:hypothetical protein
VAMRALCVGTAMAIATKEKIISNPRKSRCIAVEFLSKETSCERS